MKYIPRGGIVVQLCRKRKANLAPQYNIRGGMKPLVVSIAIFLDFTTQETPRDWLRLALNARAGAGALKSRTPSGEEKPNAFC
jgi:hypothetical protein